MYSLNRVCFFTKKSFHIRSCMPDFIAIIVIQLQLKIYGQKKAAWKEF